MLPTGAARSRIAAAGTAFIVSAICWSRSGRYLSTSAVAAQRPRDHSGSVRILLLGGTGVIGQRLGPLLLADGHDVSVTTRHPKSAETLHNGGLRPLILDVLDRAAVHDVFARFRFDLVMHQVTDLAGADPAANARVRTIGTRNLVDAAKKHGVKRMIAQSISWAYKPGDIAAEEATPLDLDAPPPRSTTVAAIAALESAVAEIPEAVVLRYGTLYGPGTWYARGGRISEQVLQGQVTATSDITSFVHADDAAAAAMSALHWPAGPVNIVDDDPAAGWEWLPLYSAALGGPPPPMDLRTGSRIKPTTNHRAASLGWRPAYATWRDGLLSSVAKTP